MLCLASAHALVRLDDGTIVGDPMEKTALEALDWALISGDKVAPTHPQAAAALKPEKLGDRTFTTVEGASETIKRLPLSIPDGYNKTCKWFTTRSSRILALALKGMDAMSNDKIVHLDCELVESNLRFAGLVFNCTLQEDAVETIKALADSSHRVRELPS